MFNGFLHISQEQAISTTGRLYLPVLDAFRRVEAAPGTGIFQPSTESNKYKLYKLLEVFSMHLYLESGCDIVY
jgi:hypothetical protein